MNTDYYVAQLREHGFHVVEGGNNVIVIGERGSIPIDRPTGVFDLMSSTTARRFDSAKQAVEMLVKVDPSGNRIAQLPATAAETN